METALVIVSLISLVAAAASLATTWQILRRERRRSEARVAALAAAAAEDPQAPEAESVHSRPRSSSAWGPALSDVRASTGSARTESRGLVTNGVEAWSPTRLENATHLFDTVRRQDAGFPHLGLALGIGVLLVGATVGSVLIVSRTREPQSHAASQPSVPMPAPAVAPLELVTLRHERSAKALTIAGLVRNPATGTKVEHLSAVVVLLDRSGAPISSRDVKVDFRALAPGEESPFAVTLTDPGPIARYRVSFRTDSGVVPHVDRRVEATMATRGV